MKAQIFTPTGTVFEGEVSGIQMPGVDGGFEVRQDHARMVSLLEIGKIVVKTADQGTLIFAISGGFTEISDNVVTVMAEEALTPDQIDLPADELKKKEIEGELRNLKIDTTEHTRTESELRKIANRVKIAQN